MTCSYSGKYIIDIVLNSFQPIVSHSLYTYILYIYNSTLSVETYLNQHNEERYDSHGDVVTHYNCFNCVQATLYIKHVVHGKIGEGE